MYYIDDITAHLSEIWAANDDLTPGGGAENTFGEGRSKGVLQESVHVESNGTTERLV